MNSSPDHTSAISRKRALIEKRLVRLLRQTGSDATLDDIKTLIFNEEEALPFIAYVMQLCELFGDEADDDAVIPAVQDAWNYFPHRRFGGLCPAEQMLRQVPRADAA